MMHTCAVESSAAQLKLLLESLTGDSQARREAVEAYQRKIDSFNERLKEKEAERLNHKISMIVPGTVVEGRVESLMPYGAFVDLGDGLSGLVHISQISQKRLKKPSEVLTVGDTVRAVVLNTKDNRISLSIKAAAESAEPDELEEKQAEEYSSNEAVGTSLGDLLKGLKL